MHFAKNTSQLHEAVMADLPSSKISIYQARSSTPAKPLMTSKSLQALRAIAALLVILFHVNHSIFGLSKYWPDRPFGELFEFGHAGVEFFFVLSGFIIFTAHRADIGRPGRLLNFVSKRARRIYPVYWIVLLLVGPVLLLVPSFGANVDRGFATIIESATLLHLFGGSEMLTVSWTLFHEILFYSVFSLLILDRRIGVAALGLWLAASLLSFVQPLPTTLAFYLSPLHLLFAMGMGAAMLVTSRRIPAAALVGLSGIAVFAAAAVWEINGVDPSADILALIYGAGSTLIVVAAIELERTGRLRVPGFLVFLGDASYSIYLVHFVALSVLAKIAVTVTAHVPVPHSLVFVGLAVSSAAVGVVFHLYVEVPLLALMRQRRPALSSFAPAGKPARAQ